MLKHFYRSVCYTSLNHGFWSISVVMKQVTCTETFILKCILITWLKTWYHTFTWESNAKKNVLLSFFPEHSCIALRRNSAKFNSGALLSVLVCFCCNVSVTFVWNSTKGCSFDICDNSSSYCTCASWKYFSNSYFVNLRWTLHLLSNKKMSG